MTFGHNFGLDDIPVKYGHSPSCIYDTAYWSYSRVFINELIFGKDKTYGIYLYPISNYPVYIIPTQSVWFSFMIMVVTDTDLPLWTLQLYIFIIYFLNFNFISNDSLLNLGIFVVTISHITSHVLTIIKHYIKVLLHNIQSKYLHVKFKHKTSLRQESVDTIFKL